MFESHSGYGTPDARGTQQTLKTASSRVYTPLISGGYLILIERNTYHCQIEWRSSRLFWKFLKWHIKAQLSLSLNDAALLSEGAGLEYSCCHLCKLCSVHAGQLLRISSLQISDVQLFRDGSSFVQDGIRRLGYTVKTV